MEISPEDAVPYLDRVPYGVVELLRRLGATIVPSGPLVSRFAAGWSAAEAEDHRFAAEILAEVAQAELARAVGEGDTGLSETALQARVVAAAEARGLVFDTLPIVGFGPNSANPHYEPHAGPRRRPPGRRGGAARSLGRAEPDHRVRRPDLDGIRGEPGPGPGAAGVGDGARRARRGDRGGAAGRRGRAGRSPASRPTAPRAA